MDSKDYEVGYKKPPKNRRFGQPDGNPQRRGLWDVESSPRFKLEQMMKLTEQELVDVANDKQAPYFERKLARCINKGEWREIESMINQVYGQPKQTVEQHNVIPTPLAPVRQEDIDACNNRLPED